jgi:prepilin peptidase CpaA
MTPAALASLLALGLAGLVASWLDWRHRRLPNWLSAMLAVLGLAAAFRYGGIELFGSNLIHAAIALCVAIILHAFGWIGGGDGKYYAAAACWFPLGFAIVLLFCVAASGLGLFSSWFALRRLRGTEMEFDPDNPDAAKLPYGLAIAAGSFAAAVLTSL